MARVRADEVRVKLQMARLEARDEQEEDEELVGVKCNVKELDDVLGNFFFRGTQTFCRNCALTISDMDKRFFASKRRGNVEHSVRFTFFDFDPCPEIFPDIAILKLHYSMSDFPNPWMNTAQTPSVVYFGHTVNISTIFRLFKAIL